MSVNTYGKGKAYYVAAESNCEMMKWLIEKIAAEVELGERWVEVPLKHPGKGVLTKKQYDESMVLDGYQCELIVCE